MIFEWVVTALLTASVHLHDSYNDRVVYIKKDQVKIVYIKR